MKDLTDLKFERLTVIKHLNSEKVGKKWNHYVKCKCDCGNTKRTIGRYLTEGKIRSCGCLKSESKKTHGLSRHPLYRTWIDMKLRCYDEKHSAYKYCGACGVKVFEQWLDFMTFYKWAIEYGWEKGKIFARVNHENDYTPDNCFFTFDSGDNQSTKKQVRVNYRGMELTLKTACRHFKKDYNLVRHRLYQGWDVDEAFDTPKHIPNVRKEKRLEELLKRSK